MFQQFGFYFKAYGFKALQVYFNFTYPMAFMALGI